MRMTQFHGLHSRAEELLTPGDVCPTCKTPLEKFHCVPDIAGETAFGMFGEEFPLGVYFLKAGGIAREFVQWQEWSSGPVIVTALKDEKGNWIEESLWTREEYDEVS